MLRTLYGLLALKSQAETRDAETSTSDRDNKPASGVFPELGYNTSIWIEVQKIPFKTVGIFSGDGPIKEGRIVYLWVFKTKGEIIKRARKKLKPLSRWRRD